MLSNRGLEQSGNEPVTTEGADLCSHVRERRAQMDVVASRGEMEGETDALPAAFPIIGNQHGRTDRNADFQHIPHIEYVLMFEPGGVMVAAGEIADDRVDRRCGAGGDDDPVWLQRIHIGGRGTA
jgi:hypothetical protein